MMEKENLNTTGRPQNRFFHYASLGLSLVALVSSVLTFLEFGKDQPLAENENIKPE